MQVLDFLLKKIKEKSKILLMFDYDGTLTPIVERPELAILDKDTRKYLEILADKDFVKIVIITGRQIKVFKELSDVKNPKIMIFGLHGGEVQLDNKIISHVSNSKKEVLKDFVEIIAPKLADFEGINLEYKEYSVSLHYRLADYQTTQDAIKIFKNYADKLGLEKYFRFQEGKKVIELLPAGFSKNKAVNSVIINNIDYLPVYFGDDLTDISAFEEVKKFNGVSVGVGEIQFDSGQINDQITVNELNDFLKRVAKEV